MNPLKGAILIFIFHRRDAENAEDLFFAGLGDNGPTNVSALRSASLARSPIYRPSAVVFSLPPAPGKGKE